LKIFGFPEALLHIKSFIFQASGQGRWMVLLNLFEQGASRSGTS
jgi:hypothetical protein